MILATVQSAPAETTIYMIAGYSVIFSIMLIYIISLVVRNHKVKRDLNTLKEMDKK